MSWALRHSRSKLGDRLVLLALAEAAHDDGTYAFPKVATLAIRANLSERQVQRCLRNLVGLGEIEQTGQTKSGTNIYSVTGYIRHEGGDNMSPPAGAGVTPTSPLGVTPTSPELSVEPLEEQPLAAKPRKRNGNWDALTSLFGDATTRTSQKLRGKVCASLDHAGATPDEIIGRAKRWRHVFPNAALTETALEKHWPLLQPPRARAPASVRSEPQPSPLTAVEREANVRAAKAGLQELRRNL